MQSSGPALEAAELTKRYPRSRRLLEALRAPWRREHVQALRGISLTVPRGTVHGLLGENGAGKTTFVKILATLVLPTSGTVRVLGQDVVTDGARVRRSIGLVTAEERSFYWRLTGRDNLRFFAALHDLGRGATRRVDELLDLVGLRADSGRPFREYSTGMRQRLAIARGLLAGPSLLLMDEPTRGLDPPAAAWLRTFVRDELSRGQGATVLMATHDLREAEIACDSLSLVRQGRIVAEGSPLELKRSLAIGRSHLLTLQEPVPATVATRLEAVTGADTSRATFRVRGDDEAAARAVAEAVADGARVVELRAEEGDLAALFALPDVSEEAP